jgi:hypothetical protein
LVAHILIAHTGGEHRPIPEAFHHIRLVRKIVDMSAPSINIFVGSVSRETLSR